MTELKNPRYVAITLTPELAAALAKATPEGSTPGLYARTVLAEHLGVAISSTRQAARKYPKTPEGEAARKAAQGAARVAYQAMLKTAMAEYKARAAAALAAQAAEAKAAEAAVTKIKPAK